MTDTLEFEAADLLVFVVDSATGITEEDARVADVLRRSGRPVLVAANKVDDEVREGDAWEFLGLGLLDLYHHLGAREYLDRSCHYFRPGRPVQLVPEADARARAALDQDLVAVVNQFQHTAGGQAHAVFMGFYFLWHT